MVSIALLVVALVVFGSWLYWMGEGRPPTPAQFRDRVAATGLVVDWDDNGPRGGDGVVDTDCGTRTVTVSSFADDDGLWLIWDGGRAELTASSARSFTRCELG